MRIKIIGYCILGAIAFALFIMMCAILRDAIITHDLSVQAQADNAVHATEPTPARSGPHIGQ